jgi:microcystin-dependent protein
MPKFVNTLKNAELTSDPTAVQGTLYYNSSTDQIKVKGASTWSEIATPTITEMPTGSVIAWIGSTASKPVGWLNCNGGAVSRTTYADLFAVIGTNFGAGDGSTTFNMPDFRGLSLVGAVSANAGIAVGNTAGGIVWAQGTSDPFGSITHTTDTWAHTHTFSDDSQGSHTHATDHSTTVTFSSATASSAHNHTYVGTASTVGHAHTIANLNAASGTVSVGTSINDDAPLNSHTHTTPDISGGNSHTHTITESVGNSTGHNHTFTGSTTSYTGTSGSTGAHTHGGTYSSDATASHTHSDHSANRARVWYLVKT